MGNMTACIWRKQTGREMFYGYKNCSDRHYCGRPFKSGELNRLLHEYGEYIVGRMGVPYRPKGVSVISVILDAPQEKISALSGKLGMLEGITSKTVYSKMPEKEL